MAKFFFETQDIVSPDLMISEIESTSTQPIKRALRKDEFPDEIQIVSWNVDGFDPDQLEQRFNAVLFLIAKHDFDYYNWFTT